MREGESVPVLLLLIGLALLMLVILHACDIRLGV